MTLIDTHAGAGVYDLGADEARKSGEAAAGIARLAVDPTAPEAFDTLLAAVARINDEEGAGVRFYPGSPMLIASAMREGDRFVACELRPGEHAALAELLSSNPDARALNTDGFDAAVAYAGAGGTQESIIDGVSGVLVGSPAEFTAALGALLRDAAVRERLAEGALQHSAGYTWGHSQAAFAHVVASALRGELVSEQDATG